MNHCDMDL